MILLNLLEGHDTDVIYLDFAKAFDKVDYEILLKKLHSYGIRGKLLTWLTYAYICMYYIVCIMYLAVSIAVRRYTC